MAKKYFGTDGIRGRVGTWPITPEFVLKLGWALGQVLKAQKPRNKVLVGKDTRISGYMFEAALEAGLAASGTDIELVGPMPTPAIAYLTRTFRAQAGIVISASHNPYQDNGIKFFSAEGYKFPDEVELAIEQYLEDDMRVVDSSSLGKALRLDDAQGRYIEFCKSTVGGQFSLAGLKIVLDCANGATYHVAPAIFRELGANVIELAVNPDGLNINTACGATDLKMLQRIVLAEEANLGVAFDGDGDRVMMVDHKGHVLDGDELMYIIVRHQQRQKRAVPGVVGTLMTNLGLEIALKNDDIPFVRTNVGDRHVINELQRSGWRLGGEGSGHIVCLDKTTTGDGIVSALQVLQAVVETGRSLVELRVGMRKYPQILINVPIQKTIHLSHPEIEKAVHAAEKQLGQQGRVLLRPSGTEPLLRVMVEGEEGKQVRQIAEGLAAVISNL